MLYSHLVIHELESQGKKGWGKDGEKEKRKKGLRKNLIKFENWLLFSLWWGQ